MRRKIFLVSAVIVTLALIASSVLAACNKKDQSEEEGFYYNGILLGVTEQADYDGDWLSDRLEFHEYGTDPLKIDTDGDGIDDFNEIFTYPHLLNPLDPTDAKEFLAKLPNVEAKYLGRNSGGTPSSGEKSVSVAKRDPLVKWYAEHMVIVWMDSAYTYGFLKVDGKESLFLEFSPNDSADPSYVLTHGRKGICYDVRVANYTIFELMGYESLIITGKVDGEWHGWVEANIDGKVYVVDFNRVERAETFYARNNWTIESREDF